MKRLRYQPDRGFYHARDSTGHRYLLLDSQVPSNIPGRTDSLIEALSHFDHAFETRWFRSSFMDPMWNTTLPTGHCVPLTRTRDRDSRDRDMRDRDQGYRDQRDRDLRDRDHRDRDSRDRNYDRYNTDGHNKRTKLGGPKMRNPDFINHSPLMECTTQISQYKSVLQTLYGKFHAPLTYPRFPTNTGTSQTLCLNSSFVAPHNTCTTRLCGDRKCNPRMARLHIDLSRDEWKKKPEAYWDPLVAFLLHSEVTPHICPTQALKKLTPNAAWP